MRSFLVRVFLAVPFLLALHASLGDARTWNVNVRGVDPDGPFRFVPDTLQIAYGDTVRWTWIDGEHSTTEFDGNACTGGLGLWNAPIDQLHPNFTLVFNQSLLPPGNATVLYECSNHCFLGMDGVIFITATGIEHYDPLSDPPRQTTKTTWGRLKVTVIPESPR
jgi:plastocyanin